MQRYKLTLCYDGSGYLGWQKCAKGPTIQEALSHAIKVLSAEEALPQAASRTDRGVHAEGQVVSFTLVKTWDLQKLLKGLNALLPEDIRVLQIAEVPLDFHPTLDAKEKEYRYRVCLSAVQDPTERLYSWHYPFPLDLPLLQKEAKGLLGTWDFSAFTTEKEKEHTCTLFSVDCIALPEEKLELLLCADRFLYKMARGLVGTLLQIGSGKLSMPIQKILLSKERRRAGMTAPAHGLFLKQVLYY